jgi:hypothetical protein
VAGFTQTSTPLGSYEPFPALGAGTFDRTSPIGKNRRDLSEFLKNNTMPQLGWQEIVDFSS